MKIRNNARNGIWISIAILIIALAMLLIVENIPEGDINTLNEFNKWRDNLGINKEETPTWKIVCYIIAGVLIIMSVIVNFVMCRCHYCGRHIHGMDVFTMYCPYCSKDLSYKEKD